jgi:NitT/TauT family transport system substrate-binding protein
MGMIMRGLGVAALMLMIFALRAPAAAETAVRVGYMPIAEELPKIVANERGFFKRNDLNAELVRFENGPDMGTALLGGSIQIGMIGTPGLVNAAVAGRPLVAIVDNGSNVVGPSGYEYYTGLVVLDDSPVREIGDLKGKKIAINVLKANSEAQTVMQVLRWNREHPDRALDLNRDVQFVTIPFGSMPTALEQRRVDAASMIEPFMTQLSLKQKVRVVAPVSYALPNWPVSFGIVRRDYGAKNVDVLQKYRTSWFEAVKWIRENQDQARAYIPQFTGVPLEVARQIVLPHWSEDIKSTERSTEQLMDGMLVGGMIQKKATLSDIMVDDLLSLQK